LNSSLHIRDKTTVEIMSRSESAPKKAKTVPSE